MEEPSVPADKGLRSVDISLLDGEELTFIEEDRSSGEVSPASVPMRAAAAPPSTSGLKAGYSDDNRQFNYFVNFLEEFKAVPHLDIDISERIIINIKDTDGLGIPNAIVSIKSGGRTLTTGTTLADGSFRFFPSLFSSDLKNFEVLVEDASGKIMLDSILKKILRANEQDHSFKIHSYKGIGRIPKNLQGKTDPRKRILLDRLPKLLKGYGKSLKDFPAAVIVVVDLDKKNCVQFKQEMLEVLNTCNPKPITLFRIAIEEVEAWILGDSNAINIAYPRAKNHIISNYVQDSICDTWEKLADSIYNGGSKKLTELGWPYTGQAKCEWAETISPHMNVDANKSKSFQVFRDSIRKIAEITTN